MSQLSHAQFPLRRHPNLPVDHRRGRSAAVAEPRGANGEAVTGSGGRLHFGMVAGIKSERWPTSNRNPRPDCLGIRSQAPEAKTRGYDAGKKIVGRKRHIAVDTDGRLLMVNLTPADISDSAGAQMILDGVRKRWPWLKHLFADGAYDRTQLMDKAALRDFTIQIIKRSDAAVGFEVIPRRWVVERTFAWMTRWRRLVRDYEERIDCSEAMIHVARGSVLLRRIAHE